MFSETYTGTCSLPLWTAIGRPMKSGMMVERRDQVLLAFCLWQLARLRLFSPGGRHRTALFSMNESCATPYFLPRRETIMEEVRLLLRVFLPLVCWPQGDTG